MKYYLNLFIQEFVKTCKIAMRYKFDTIFYIFFWAVLSVIISHVLSAKHPGNVPIFVSSFMIWLITNNSFIAIVESIMKENTQGTLEQLYLNARSFYSLLIIKGVAVSILSIIESMITLSLCLLFVPNVKFSMILQWIYVLPLLFIAIFSLIGIGMTCASFALKYKNISNFYSMVSSILFGILTYGAIFLNKKPILTILFPFAKANATIQLFLRGKAQISVNAYTIIIINDLLMMALGYVVLKYYLKESKKSGSLSKF